ncbi:MAG: protein kinase domain-containing protein [Gemmatimonadaceae bacterium]
MLDAPAFTMAPLADRYTIERELGRGGMATVYLAEEKKHGRKVAIKVMRPELAASVGATRFLREIGIAARLSHPHIVPLIDSGDADGLLYYVSPFVRGGSLRDLLQRDGRLPIRDVLRIVQEVGMGLDYAHRAGFVHRDVKPENILFADGHALLADFGVARARCAADGASVTDAGIVLGTPEYMSPEQASGEPDLESRSDVYSLACVVFEMLAGEPPFRGDGARAVMAKHVTEEPRSIRALRPETSSAIGAAIATALAKDPDRRFASVAEFVEAIQASTPERGLPFRAATLSIAVLPFVNVSADPGNEYLSDGITDELIDGLSKLKTLRVASRTSVFALKGKPQDVRVIGTLLGASVVLEGTVRKDGQRLRITAQLTSISDGRLIWSQRYDRELSDVFTIQDEIARTIVTTLRATSFADLGEPVAKRHTASVKAYGLYLRGRYAWNKRTQEGVAEGIEYFEQAIREDPQYALAYTGLADAYALHVDLSQRPGVRGVRASKGVRAESARSGRGAGRGPRLSRVEPFHLRLGVGRRRARISPRARAGSGLRHGASVVLDAAHVQGSRSGGVGGGTHRTGARSGVGLGAPHARLGLLLCAEVRTGHLSSQPGHRDESHGRGDVRYARTRSGGGRTTRRCGARSP